jgi:XapX domain-containing protein
LLSLGTGLAVGIAYALVGVRSPAPPIIALVGLLGILAGEAAVSFFRGQQNVLGNALHLKSFAIPTQAPQSLLHRTEAS